MNQYLLTIVMNRKDLSSKVCTDMVNKTWELIQQKNFRNISKSEIIQRYEVSSTNNYLHTHTYISCKSKWYFNVKKPHASLQINYKHQQSQNIDEIIQTEKDMVEYVTKMDSSYCPGLNSSTVEIYYDYYRGEFITPEEHPTVIKSAQKE